MGRYVQCKCSNAAPGVIFGPDDDSFSSFLMEPDSSGNNKLVMSSLVDWNYRESFRLLNLILGLREQYVAYQRKRVGEVEDERIKFEISTILHREGIEMMVTGVGEETYLLQRFPFENGIRDAK